MSMFRVTRGVAVRTNSRSLFSFAFDNCWMDCGKHKNAHAQCTDTRSVQVLVEAKASSTHGSLTLLLRSLATMSFCLRVQDAPVRIPSARGMDQSKNFVKLCELVVAERLLAPQTSQYEHSIFLRRARQRLHPSHDAGTAAKSR